jgi:HJR/Mrr/RecB family endonuclease
MSLKDKSISRENETAAQTKLQQKEAKAIRAKEKTIRENARRKADAISFMQSTAEPNAIKIGKILDLCCELIPVSIANKIITDCLKMPFISPDKLPKTLSDIFISSFYYGINMNGEIDDRFLSKNINWGVISGNGITFIIYGIPIPKSIIMDYNIIIQSAHFEHYDNAINKYKKSNCYTAALIVIIYYLLNNNHIKSSFLNPSLCLFKNLYFIGDLFIDIGAIDSALRLYKIDKSIFNTPNRLSLLANKAVLSGNLDDSIKLVENLIEQEPHHPSIPIIQAEIKRLEQRHRLKSTFSIDFSKIDELSGIEFENLLMDKFIAMGFKVESTPKTGDFGADLIIENNEGTRIIVQCKRFKSKVNLKAVQEVVGAMGHYAGDMGLVITNNSYLNSAVKLAESHDIELWDGDKLVSFLAGDLSFSEIINVIE